MISDQLVMEENSGLIHLTTYFFQVPGWQRLNFMPRSEFKILDEELYETWTSFKQNIENFRLQVPEFNSLYTDKKAQKKHIKSKKSELYSTLFMIISLAELQMHHSIKKYMDLHRINLIKSQSGVFSKNFVWYIISLKNQ